MKKVFFGLLGLIFSLGFFSFALAAPIPITNIQARQEGNNVILTWNAASGMENYKVFRPDGTLYENGAVGGATAYTLTNAQPNTNYVFKIRGYKRGSTNSSGDAQGETSLTTAATATTSGQPVKIGARFPGEPESVDLIDHIMYAHAWASVIGTLLAVLMIIFAGFKYATSAGNPEALQDAKDTIFGALIGLSIIILTYLLLQVFGARVVKGP